VKESLADDAIAENVLEEMEHLDKDPNNRILSEKELLYLSSKAWGLECRTALPTVFLLISNPKDFLWHKHGTLQLFRSYRVLKFPHMHRNNKWNHMKIVTQNSEKLLNLTYDIIYYNSDVQFT